MHRLSTRDDRGDTLVELMVALVIMATAVVALVGGIGTSVKASDIHRKMTKSGVYLRAFAEAVETSVASYPSGYTECTASSTPGPTYKATFAVAPADTSTFLVDNPIVAVWNRTTSTFTTCPATGDAGVQRVTLRIYTSDGRASEKIDIVVRKPCRPPVDPPLVVSSFPEGTTCV